MHIIEETPFGVVHGTVGLLKNARLQGSARLADACLLFSRGVRILWVVQMPRTFSTPQLAYDEEPPGILVDFQNVVFIAHVSVYAVPGAYLELLPLRHDSHAPLADEPELIAIVEMPLDAGLPASGARVQAKAGPGQRPVRPDIRGLVHWHELNSYIADGTPPP
jgi:hypothetical protein